MNKLEIYDLLLEGKENAISTAELCSIVNVTPRELQKMIERERRCGALILSRTKGGYFKSNDRAELSEFVRTLNNRARSTIASLQGAKDALDRIDGQITITDNGTTKMP
ncbi:MAG: hypothetical protein Q4D42_12565 [Eubacteriales bacterium]|nr:hypothetical protein [Eubacteriales bacterium]